MESKIEKVKEKIESIKIDNRIKALIKYLESNHMTIQNLADAVEIPFGTMYKYIRTDAVSKSRERFWIKVNEVTGLNLKINYDVFSDSTEEIKIEAVERKQLIPIYIPQHLKTYGNCVVGNNLLKRLGANKVLEYLDEEFGLRCMCTTGSESKAKILVLLNGQRTNTV